MQARTHGRVGVWAWSVCSKETGAHVELGVWKNDKKSRRDPCGGKPGAGQKVCSPPPRLWLPPNEAHPTTVHLALCTTWLHNTITANGQVTFEELPNKGTCARSRSASCPTKITGDHRGSPSQVSIYTTSTKRAKGSVRSLFLVASFSKQVLPGCYEKGPESANVATQTGWVLGESTHWAGICPFHAVLPKCHEPDPQLWPRAAGTLLSSCTRSAPATSAVPSQRTTSIPSIQVAQRQPPQNWSYVHRAGVRAISDLQKEAAEAQRAAPKASQGEALSTSGS